MSNSPADRLIAAFASGNFDVKAEEIFAPATASNEDHEPARLRLGRSMNEVIRKAINAIYTGSLVECTKEEYHEGLRTKIQEYAGTCIDTGDTLRATIALQEVRRLDAKHGLTL